MQPWLPWAPARFTWHKFCIISAVISVENGYSSFFYGKTENSASYTNVVVFILKNYVKKVVCMESYKSFAEVYDLFMDNVPYDEWAKNITRILGGYGIKDGLIAELGCGTGQMTRRLRDAGYDMIGVDNSEEMLQQAMEKRAESGRDILYLMQDMRSFELYGTVRAIVSLCDCMNYILTREDLVQVLRLANNYLDPGGVFIFDLNTEHKYATMGTQTIAEDREDCSFIWENEYRPEERLNEYDLAVFVRQEDDLFRKYTETHLQRAWTVEEIRSAAEEAGMEWVAVYGALSVKAPEDDCERIYVILREKGKQ